MFKKSKIAFLVSGLLIASGASASSSHLHVDKKTNSATISSLQTAVKVSAKDEPKALTVAGKTMVLDTIKSAKDGLLYSSENKRDFVLLKEKDGNRYGSAVIDGVSYNIFNGLVTPVDVPESSDHASDYLVEPERDDKSSKRQLKRIQEEKERKAILELNKDFSNVSATSSEIIAYSGQSYTPETFPIIVGGQEILPRSIPTERAYSPRDLRGNDVFSPEQVTAIKNNNTTLKNFAAEDGTLTVDIDHLLHTGAVLESYEEFGASSIARLSAQIDSSIDSSNVILDNSFLGDVQLNNKSITLIHDFADFPVGNSLVDEFNGESESIIYLATDMESTYWGDRGEGTCGFAYLGSVVDMKTPDDKAIANTGPNDFDSASPEWQFANIDGVSRTGCLDSRVLLHEIGHNIGLNHDAITENIDFTDENYAYTFNRGALLAPTYDENETVTERGKYSLMAYPCTDCSYEPLLSSPDRYQFELGTSAYEVDGADAALYAESAFFLKYLPKDKQVKFLPASEVERDPQTNRVTKKTYSLPEVSGASVKTLVVRNWREDTWYAYDLPVGTDTFSILTTDMPYTGDAYVLTGLNVNGTVQGVPLYKFYMGTGTSPETSSILPSSSTTDHVYPETLQVGQRNEISYKLTDEALSELRELQDNEDYSKWQLVIDEPYELEERLGTGAKVELTSTLESVLEDGVISFAFDVPNAFPTQKYLDLLNNQDESQFDSFVVSSRVEYERAVDFGAPYTSYIGYTYFTLALDGNDMLAGTSIVADSEFVFYRKEEQEEPLTLSFTLESSSGRYEYDVSEGFARTGVNANAIVSTSEVDNGDGTMTVFVEVDASVIDQPQGDGYFITVTNRNGLPATATTLLKDNDIPYFDGPSSYLTDDTAMIVSVPVYDLQPGVEYVAEARGYYSVNDDYDYVTYVDVDVSIEDIDETSKQLTATFELNRKYGTDDRFGIAIAPMLEDGSPSDEIWMPTRAYTFTIEQNVAPVITCFDENDQEVVSDVCRIPTAGIGETLISEYYVSDQNTQDTLSFDWTINSDLFGTEISGDAGQNLTVNFPEQADKDWEELSYSLQVSDGKLSTSSTFILVNENYEANVAPVITCNDGCSSTVSGTGDYTFSAYSVTDEGEDDPLTFQWSSENSPFPIEQVGNDVVIAFPDSVDTSWESFTLTLTVTDQDMNGGLSSTETFTLVNADYDDGSNGGDGDNGGDGGNGGNGDNGGTTTDVPQSNLNSSDSGGGSMGFLTTLFLGSIVALRRRVKR